MGSSKNTQSDSVEALVLTEDNWTRKLLALKRDGLCAANRMERQGNRFIVRMLAPKEVREGDTIPLSGVVLNLDWKIATRLEMVEFARDFIAKAYVLDSLDSGLPTVLKSIIEGKGLYEYNIGEFFLQYGRFQEKYHLDTEAKAKAKMESLMNGDQEYLKPYVERGKSNLVPLPWAVRQTLAHRSPGNQLDLAGKELGTSIDLLRSWVDAES